MKKIINFLLESLILENNEVSKIESAKNQSGFNQNCPGKCGWFKTAEECVNALYETPIGKKFLKKYFSGMEKSQVTNLISFIYSKTVEPINWSNAPLIFGAKSCIMGVRSSVDNDIYNEFNKSLNGKVGIHNGFGGARTITGLSYEKTVRNNIINFINETSKLLVANNIPKNSGVFNDLTSYLTDEFPEFIVNEIKNSTADDSIKSTDLNVLIKYIPLSIEPVMKQLIIDNTYGETSLNLQDYVILTGGKNTRRNKNNEILNLNNNKFEIIKFNPEDFAKSGSKIADITVISSSDKNNEFYVSVKLDKHQLSSVNCMDLFENNAAFNEFINDVQANSENIDEAYDKLTRDTDFNIIKTFCEAFQISPKEVCYRLAGYDNYKIGNENDWSGNLTHVQSKSSSASLIDLIINLVGGNYWFISQSEIYNVPKLTSLSSIAFKMTGGNMSPDNKHSMTFNISINDFKMRLILRTSDRNVKFPYRIFPECNIKKLINTLNTL